MEDESGTRRTRSARSKVVATEASVPTRTSRRTRKQVESTEDEDEPQQLEDVAPEPVEEVAPMEITDDDYAEQFELIQSTNDDNGSSNFAFDDNYEQQSNEVEEIDETTGQEIFMPDLADLENANSFPSACDDSFVEKSQQVSESKQIDFSDNMYDINDAAEDEQSVDKTEDTLAQREETKPGDPDATSLDAENISEDELPGPAKPKVQDAEEVSDEELPGPKMAELPADTEVVSEDELPALKKEGKRKHDDSDANEEVEEKKVKTEDEKPKHRLPDLEKYWKAVKADPLDFNAWTYLLQYVDSESDVEAAREAYDKFLSRYCYCYGYWRKYADYEKKKGSPDKCDEVFERGLKAIPLSIDLWIHYLTHIKQKHDGNLDLVRNQFERALKTCGLEFRSDKLWDGYIKWEKENCPEGKNLLNVIAIYDRLLATPTQGYKTHWDSFRELVNNSQVQKLLTANDFIKYRDEIRKDSEPKSDDQVPPGEDEPSDHLRNEEEADAIRKIIISKRKKVNKATVEMINKRWSFEEGIKRPYFHVKQLERIQLKNWKEYLDFEIEQGDRKRILVLFERCLIACALYEEFWLKLVRYLEVDQDDPEFESRTRDVFERACTIHHADKPSLLMMWAAFEEAHRNIDKAAEILQKLDKVHPNLLQVAYSRINLERRRGDFDRCEQLFDQHIAAAKNKNISAALSIKFARFMSKIRKNLDAAMKILKNSLAKDPTNTRVALQVIDLALQRDEVDEKEVLNVLDSFMTQDSLDPEQKLLFAQRKVEFLEDFGSSVKNLHDAQKSLQTILEKTKETKKKTSGDHEPSPAASKKLKDSSYNGNPYSSAPYSYSSNQGHYSSSSYPSAGYDYNQQSYYQQAAYGYGNQWGNYGSSY